MPSSIVGVNRIIFSDVTLKFFTCRQQQGCYFPEAAERARTCKPRFLTLTLILSIRRLTAWGPAEFGV